MTSDHDRLMALVEQRRCADDHRTWGYHSRVSVPHRCVCVAIPKVACTTIKTVLRQLDGLPPAEQIHDEGQRLTDFTVEDNVEMIAAPDWLRFSFVRNPYRRLYSAYKSKIGNTWEQQYDWLRVEIREAFGYPVRDGVRAGMVTFDDFVRYVAESDDQRIVTDGHLAVQTAILQQDCISYDVIGRFESFQTDFTEILNRLDAPAGVLARTSKIINPTPYSPLAAAYRGELADIVHALYAADFETWHYRKDSWLFDDD